MRLECVEDFIKEVEEERKARGWTKEKLSLEAFNNANAKYSHLSIGKYSPMVITLDKVAKALGMKLVICLMEDDKNPGGNNEH